MLPTVSLFDEKASKEAGRLLKRYVSKWKKDISLISTLKFFSFILNAVQWIMLAELLSNLVLVPIQPLMLVKFLVVFIGAGAGKAICLMMADLSAARLNEKVTCHIRKWLLEDIDSPGSEPIKNDRSAGNVPPAFINKAEVIAPYLSQYIPQTILCMVSPFAVIAYLATVNWVCAVMLLFIAPAIPVFMIIIGKGTEAKSQQQWQNLSKMGGYMEDCLHGMTTLYLFDQMEQVAQKIKQTSEEYARSVLEVLKIAFLSSAVLEFFSAIMIAGAAVYIGLNMIHYVNWGPTTFFSLQNGLIVLLLLPEFFIGLKVLGNYYHDRTLAFGAVMDLQQSGFLQYASAAKEGDPIEVDFENKYPEPVSNLNTGTPLSISMSRVCFTYNEKRSLFEGLDLHVLPGEKIRIAGANGVGKTSLIHLLLKWKQPREGEIFLGDVNIKALNEREINERIGLVSQSTTIFAGTIRSNILMGAQLSDESLFEEVIKPAGLLTLIEKLPEGLDTPVKEYGRSLSGGERQKIGLARALVRKTPVLLLDEPLTHLDQASAADFLNMLNVIGKKKTIIITGHGEAYHALSGYRVIKLG